MNGCPGSGNCQPLLFYYVHTLCSLRYWLKAIALQESKSLLKKKKKTLALREQDGEVGLKTKEP